MFLREGELVGKIAPHVERGQGLLDLGSGTGLIARRLAQRVGVRPTMTDLIEYDNRVRELPFIPMRDPVTIAGADGAYDVVMMLFVLHHMERWEDQERLVREAARVARRRLIVIEDTPTSRIDRALNVFWDKVLNLRHGVPTPFTFRSAEAWERVFAGAGLTTSHRDTYRAKWPTLMTYHHTLFVLDRS